MRIAIFGSGAVGGYFGARLAQAGESVAFIARGAHLAAIRRDGLNVDSICGDCRIHPAEATDDPASVGPADLVIVAVKAWQVPEVARALFPLLRDDTAVLSLQNGIEAPDQIAQVVGADRVLPGLCRIASRLAGPGRIHHSGVAPEIKMGERGGRGSLRLAALAEAFGRTQGVSAVIATDIVAALWEKFLFIAPFSGVAAHRRQPAGALRAAPETRALLQAGVQEVFDIGLRRGVRLAGNAVDRTMAFVDELPPETTASMQRDIMDGRPSELESQTGAVVRLGLETGVPTPVNRFLYDALHPLEHAARAKMMTNAGIE